jgi:hypothetical protein
MQHDGAILDHVVINVQTRLDTGAAAYGKLGFNLTERGHHTTGTSNHLAVFQQDYLELLGVESGRPTPALEILSGAIGIQALAFKMRDPDDLHRQLIENRWPAQPPEEFSRPVALPDGDADAKFRIIRLNPSPIQGGHIFFCEHLTPQLIWRREWQEHPNGAIGIAHLVIAVLDPGKLAEAFESLFGIGARRPIPGGWEVEIGGACLRFQRHEAARRCLGPALPDEPRIGVIGMGVRTRSLQAAAAALTSAGIRPVRTTEDRNVVAAADAMGVVLEFVT